MPNIAAIIKSEITRIARKLVREETQPLKKSVSPYRSDIAGLKRRIRALEQQVKKVGRVAAKAAPKEQERDVALRFSAKGLVKNRQRLDLSAADFGKLIGASGQAVYKWEEGKSRPREKYIAAIAGLRSTGKKEVRARLEQMSS